MKEKYLWRSILVPLSTLLQTSFLPRSLLPLAASALTIMPQKQSTDVRVASYNILSSHLASPSHFTTLNPDHLKADNRLPVILQQLDEEMSQQSIICLQEVSYLWGGALHTHFANGDYHFVTALYGKKFNNYMGVGIAIPTRKYKVVDVDIARYERFEKTNVGHWIDTVFNVLVLLSIAHLLYFHCTLPC
jgi:exonuclease III